MQNNPVLTKLELALHGVRLAPHDGRKFVELQLDGEISARARVMPDSNLTLVESPQGAVLRRGELQFPVRVAAPPAYAGRLTPRGVALGDIASICGAYAVVRLNGGCGLSLAGTTCALCRGRELTASPGEIWPVDEVIAALGAAMNEGAAEFVHFQLGYLPGEDAGLRVLFPYLEAVNRYFDTIIAVTMHPPANPRWIERAYAAGIDALSFNLEAADEAGLQAHFPGRARYLSRRRYLESLAHAARIFPGGAVCSELLMGLSQPARVGEAIEELAALGVMPLLGADPDCADNPTLDEATALTAQLFERARTHGLNMSWLRDLPTAITPLEGRYFVANPPQMPAFLGGLTRNRLGALATRSLAKLRRRLRVKRVRASLDSSRL